MKPDEHKQKKNALYKKKHGIPTGGATAKSPDCSTTSPSSKKSDPKKDSGVESQTTVTRNKKDADEIITSTQRMLDDKSQEGVKDAPTFKQVCVRI